MIKASSETRADNKIRLKIQDHLSSRSLKLPRARRDYNYKFRLAVYPPRLPINSPSPDYNFNAKETAGRVFGKRRTGIGAENYERKVLERLGGTPFRGQRLINLGAEFTELG